MVNDSKCIFGFASSWNKCVFAEVAQLVELEFSKLKVVGSSPIFRSDISVDRRVTSTGSIPVFPARKKIMGNTPQW